eukprot:TRINITY_DN2845_c0_g1_i10.p1 TRINITY_DN2845_c0_g1~~TRINITY_DN2845_c0_g1_i10.p1  ORF type:complete len:677 (+),score=190.37 TRINITY_DN2845_c0_g1_i10:2078-4108(+)
MGETDRCAGVRCPPPSQCYGTGECDQETGDCVDRPLADGTTCDDGSGETREDSCAAGRCAGWLACAAAADGGRCTSPLSACHKAACADSGCVLQLRDCVPCSDGDPGTAGDMCKGGACIGVALNKTRPPPVPGVLVPAANSRFSFSADDLLSGAKVIVDFELNSDSFVGLGGAVLQCGPHGDTQAAVWLNGTSRAAVFSACSGEVVSAKLFRINLRPSEQLVPKRRETVRIAVRPGILKSGVAPGGYAGFEFRPREQAVSTTLHKTPPVLPGAASMALKLRQCTEDQGPEDELDLITSPFGLKIGDSDMAAYRGALVSMIGLLGALALLCTALYGYLTAAGGAYLARHRSVEQRLGWKMRLAAARVGCIIYPLTFFYPSGVLVATTEVFYDGDTGFRVLAGAQLALSLALPGYVYYVIRHRVPQCARVEPSEPQGWCEWIFHGSESWVKVGPRHGHRLLHLFYDGFRHRDRYLLVADLLLNCALAVLQSVRPRTEAACKAMGYVSLALMGAFALYLCARRSLIAPWDMLSTAVVLLGEAACKALLVTVGYGHSADHWALRAANQLAEALALLITVQALVGLWLFLADEYGEWKALKGGGSDVAGAGWRVALFAAHWFCFHRVVPVMLSDDAPGGCGDDDSGGALLVRGTGGPPPARGTECGPYPKPGALLEPVSPV